MNSFLDKLTTKWNEGKFVCIGLDKGVFEFDKSIIDQTSDLICAYKLNSAFYEVAGSDGWKDLEQSINYIKEKSPDVVIILDAKRADIGNTNESYGQAIFNNLGVDAVTINPYPGREALKPFLDYQDKGILVWVGASGEGTDEFQELPVGDDKIPLYQVIAQHVVEGWNSNNNVGVIVGATNPDKLKKVREIVADMPILIPGIGAQGGEVETTIKAGKNSKGQGMIISSSRGIIFADNPKQATLDLHSQIQKALNYG